MISPGGNFGNKHGCNHISNKSLLQESVKVIGAKILACLSVAIQRTGTVRLPDLRA